MPARLMMMMVGMARMAVGAVDMMRGQLVIAGLIVLGSFAMVPGGLLVMFGGTLVMMDACMCGHGSFLGSG